MTVIEETRYIKTPGIYEPDEYVVYIRICDECKSPDISLRGKHLPGIINAIFIFGIIILFYGAILIGMITYKISLCIEIEFLIIPILLIYLPLVRFVERNNYYKCNNCGNEHIT
jgi:hypothetical protein